MKRYIKLSITAAMLTAGTALAGPPVIFTEGFNSDFSSQWTGSAGQNAQAWGNLTPGITNGGGTVQTEGDGFAALTVSSSTPVAGNFNGDSVVILENVELAGITYTFSGDFSWRNGDTNTLNQVNIKDNTTGFRSGASSTLNANLMGGNWTFDNATSNEFTPVTFSYTTTAADVGHPITLQVRTHRLAAGFVGSVELLADNWKVTRSNAIFTEGFNFSYTNNPPAWIGGGGTSGQFGEAAPGITNGGTAGFEGDAFAVMEVARPVDGSANIFTFNRINMPTVTSAGIKYTFTGDFGWRNGPANAAADIYVHNGWTGFDGSEGVSYAEPVNFGDIPSNTLQNYMFSYTTTEADVGSPLELRVSLADYDLVADPVELITDNWVVTIEVDEVGAFDPIPCQIVSELISNGEFDQLANENDGGNTNADVYNVNGTYGDYVSYTNRTADLVGWSPYYSDPNSPTTLVSAVGTPHVIDGNGELDGTSYLDTLVNGDDVALNSVMDYRNGMMQTNVLDGISIDTGATYQFVADLDGFNRPDATYTVALTAGSGTAVTNPANAIVDGLLTDTMDTAGSYKVTEVSGADLVGLGDVNVIFDLLNTTSIPGFPGSVVSNDVDNSELVAQMRLYSVSLGEKILPAAGDVNHDGVVNQADVDLANSYLDGSVGGVGAATRQGHLMAQGMSAADSLAYLGLTEFDLNGDDLFDVLDVDEVAALIPTDIILQVAPNGTNLNFEWNSNADKQYDLLATPSLVLTNWGAYLGYSNMVADVSGTNTLTDVPVSGDMNFFKVVEEDYVPPPPTEPQTNALSIVDYSFEIPWTSGGVDFPTAWNATLGSNPSFSVSASGGSEGSARARFANKQVVEMYQNLGTVTDGEIITVMADIAKIAGKSTGSIDFILEIGGAPVSTVSMTPTSTDDEWVTYTNTHTVVAGGELTIRFDMVAQNEWLDNVRGTKVTPAP